MPVSKALTPQKTRTSDTLTQSSCYTNIRTVNFSTQNSSCVKTTTFANLTHITVCLCPQVNDWKQRMKMRRFELQHLNKSAIWRRRICWVIDWQRTATCEGIKHLTQLTAQTSTNIHSPSVFLLHVSTLQGYNPPQLISRFARPNLRESKFSK